jgi:steroid delta-isomerase-like uncharacterized protein
MNRIVHVVLAVVTMILVGCAASGDPVKVRNIEVVEVVFSEIWSKGNVDLIDDVFAENFVGHFPAGTVQGRDGVLDRVIAHRTAFPDWTEEVEDTIADRDRVVLRFTSRGTNLGGFLGNPPTKNRVEISEVAIFELSDGRIVEQWVYPDMLSLQRQLGHKVQKTGRKTRAKAQTREELRVAYDETIRSYNGGDFDDYFTAMHDNVTYYLPSYSEPFVGKSAVRDMYSSFLSQVESAHWESTTPEFVVAGSVGMVFSPYRHTFESEGKPQVESKGRHTVVFAAADGVWIKVGESLCATPMLDREGK